MEADFCAVVSGTASLSANSVSKSSAVPRRSRAESESRPDRRDSIISPADGGKLRPPEARFSNLRREEYSGHTSATCKAHVSVNQTTIAVCGLDSSMALVDAQVCGI